MSKREKYYIWAETLNNFECQLESSASNFIILFCSAFSSSFVANVDTFLFKSALFMNPAIADFSINPFFFYLFIKFITCKFIK